MKDLKVINNEIAATEEAAKSFLKLLSTVDLDNEQAVKFIEICKLFQLNPFKKEIYATVHRNKNTGKNEVTPVVAYTTYIKRAERTGLLDGFNVRTAGSGKNLTAVLTIYRKDWKHPFIHEVDYAEAVQTKYDGTPNHFWVKMPKTMIKKTALSQGFRICFTDELAGMPYTKEELAVETIDVNTTEEATPEPVEVIAAKAKSSDMLSGKDAANMLYKAFKNELAEDELIAMIRDLAVNEVVTKEQAADIKEAIKDKIKDNLKELANNLYKSLVDSGSTADDAKNTAAKIISFNKYSEALNFYHEELSKHI